MSAETISQREQQMLDALCAAENQLRRIRLDICPTHDGKVGDIRAVSIGANIVNSLLEILLVATDLNDLKIKAVQE
jgi:hypothetical protein